MGGCVGAITTFIVEPFVPHGQEFYLSIQSKRLGCDISFSEAGGVEIEENWDKVLRFAGLLFSQPVRGHSTHIAEEPARCVHADVLLSQAQLASSACHASRLHCMQVRMVHVPTGAALDRNLLAPLCSDLPVSLSNWPPNSAIATS